MPSTQSSIGVEHDEPRGRQDAGGVQDDGSAARRSTAPIAVQPSSHVCRVICVRAGNRFRSASEKVRGAPTRPSTDSRQSANAAGLQARYALAERRFASRPGSVVPIAGNDVMSPRLYSRASDCARQQRRDGRRRSACHPSAGGCRTSAAGPSGSARAAVRRRGEAGDEGTTAGDEPRLHVTLPRSWHASGA